MVFYIYENFFNIWLNVRELESQICFSFILLQCQVMWPLENAVYSRKRAGKENNIVVLARKWLCP